jgi:hypothetical protein
VTEEMKNRLRRIFLNRYALVEIQVLFKKHLQDETLGLNEIWDKVCSDAGVRRLEATSFPGFCPKGFVEITDVLPYGRLRMSEDLAMMILALGEIP